MTTIEVLCGSATALAVDRVIGSFVTGVPGDRPLAIITATTLIIVVTLVASIAPCLRAMRIDPATTLRYE